MAVAFGSYASSLFIDDDAASGWDNVSSSAIVLGMLAINMVGSRVVDRAQSLIVVVLLAVFAVFICVTIVDIDFDLLAFSGYPPLSDPSRPEGPRGEEARAIPRERQRRPSPPLAYGVQRSGKT